MSRQFKLLNEKYYSLLGIIQQTLRKKIKRNGLPNFVIFFLF